MKREKKIKLLRITYQISYKYDVYEAGNDKAVFSAL